MVQIHFIVSHNTVHWMSSYASQVVSWKLEWLGEQKWSPSHGWQVDAGVDAGYCLKAHLGLLISLYSSACGLSMWLRKVFSYHGGPMVVKVFIWQLASRPQGKACALLSLRPETGIVCFMFMSDTVLIKVSNRASPEFLNHIVKWVFILHTHVFYILLHITYIITYTHIYVCMHAVLHWRAQKNYLFYSKSYPKPIWITA